MNIQSSNWGRGKRIHGRIGLLELVLGWILYWSHCVLYAVAIFKFVLFYFFKNLSVSLLFTIL